MVVQDKDDWRINFVLIVFGYLSCQRLAFFVEESFMWDSILLFAREGTPSLAETIQNMRNSDCPAFFLYAIPLTLLVIFICLLHLATIVKMVWKLFREEL